MFGFRMRPGLWYFMGGLLVGTVGLKILGSRDAKRGYAHVAAALLRAKDEVMRQVTAVREAYGDVIAEAREINEKRAQTEDVVVEDDVKEA